MTAARQQRKERRARIAVFAIIVSLFAGLPLGAAAGGITERIVVDRHTGLALGGYDPVAFYTDGKPLPGSPDFELQYGGAVWRFCNFGNRAAFAERPDVYMPQFGGYESPAAWLWPEGRTFG
jgi:YHS domain-containing protein